MAKCRIPWCGRELAPGEEHPDHARMSAEMAADPELEYVAIANDRGGLDVYRRRKVDEVPGL